MKTRTRIAALVAGLAGAIVIGAVAGAETYSVLDGRALSIGSIYDRTHRGVVEITTTATTKPPLPPEQQQAQGSGWVYDNRGDLVTNQHVVANADRLAVRFWNGAVYPGTVVGSDASQDLAVIEVAAPSSLLHPLGVASSDALHVGDRVVAIGSPFGLEETVTSGIVSALHRELKPENSSRTIESIQTDAAINGGSSGSPLLDERGKVVGVITKNDLVQSPSGGNVGVNFAIPSKVVEAVVPRLVLQRK